MEEENNLRPDHHHHHHDHESHVGQQSRRDRLRIHELPNNLEMNSDQQLSRNVRCSDSFYEPVVLSSSSSMARPMSNSSLAGVNHLVGGDWRSCDWMVSGWLGGTDQNHPLFTTTINAASGSMHCHNNNSPNYNMHESSNRVSTADHDQDMNFTSPGFQSSLQDVVTIASSGGSRPAGDIGSQLFHDNASAWRSHRPVHDYPHQHGGAEEFGNVASDWRTQGLSLTLSSNPPFQLGEGFVSGDIDQLPKDRHDFNNLGSACSVMPNLIISRGGSSGKSVKDVIPSAATLTRPSTGPLGPFTGYATILKNSRFLKPAQQLLDEFCSVPGSEVFRTSEVPERISGKVNMLAQAFDASDHQALMVRNSSGGGGDSAASSSTLYSSSNSRVGECAVKDRPRESCQPEYQQKKAKLAYMHEEVCRRYNQYHQQMQMVVSSFETVAGLSDATPYISMALKTVSRHFRSLRNVISDQLWHTRKALGEDLMFPATGSNKGDMLRQKFKEQNFQKHKSGGDNVGFHDPQQQVWRPQRGLPERSVATLRTWLFEHFLHPYPTDTDKHMLAAQTGLSRNQVSNWFINARVRVWKPMVEEIHMLETNSLAQANKSKENLVGEGTSREETANRVVMNALASNKHMEFPGNIGSSTNINCEQWSQEKRSRVECQIPQSIERSSFMGFMPYQRAGLEMGGLGAVSLTLGLRHTAENAQQQQFKQQEDQLQRQFGGHIFHDFVG